MTAFRIYLIVVWTALLAYTAFVVGNVGWDFNTPFNEALASGGWLGQFCADFVSLAALAGLWAGWRNGWSLLGWLLALIVFGGGSLALIAYLLILLHREKGDMRRVLLGVRG